MSTWTEQRGKQDAAVKNAVVGSSDPAPNVAQTAAALAYAAAPAQELGPGHIYVRPLLGGGHDLIDLLNTESHLRHPRRKRGSVMLNDAVSLIAYVSRHQGAATQLYGTEATGEIVAVLNDHQDAATPVEQAAGWGDFRATLHLLPTPEWRHWLGRDGKLLPQTEFAEHLEQGLAEIVEPPAAALLELAQRFEAHRSVQFKSVRLLADGARQLQYEETIEAKAGEKGSVTIPRQFRLGLAPYEGCERYELVARLRYRLESERLTIGYVLVRPHDVLREAFGDLAGAVTEGTSLTVLRGTYGGGGV